MYAFVRALSNAVARVETLAIMLLVGLIPVAIVSTVIFRLVGRPIYWIDEATVFVMVWLAFVGTSLSFKKREAISVDILTSFISSRKVSLFMICIGDVFVIIFGVTMLIMCYIWFDPVELYNLGFDLDRFSGATFNFVYEERTQTLSLAKVWFWLILPVMGATVTLHGVANLLGSCRDAGEQSGNAAAADIGAAR